MRDAISPCDEPSLSGDAELTLSSREFVALTGVSAERVRTWQRRFRFPTSTPDRRGRRGFFASDVPRVLAVRQMVAAGEPVADAVRAVLAGRPLDPDHGHLDEAFGALPTPVVAISGPAPLQVIWANAAALAAAPDGAAVELPHQLPDRTSALRHLLVEPPETPAWLAHRPWFAEAEPEQPTDQLPTPVRSMVWAYGAPAFVPAVLVVVDVPVAEADVPEPCDEVSTPQVRRDASRSEHEWAAAIGSARRALQRGLGRRAIDDALGALVAAHVVDDAMVVMPQGDDLRVVLSARGRPIIAAVSPEATLELKVATAQDGLASLGDPTTCELVGKVGSRALAAPLVAGRVEVGYLVLVSSGPAVETDAFDALVLGFASALAAAITRDRALRDLRRVRNV